MIIKNVNQKLEKTIIRIKKNHVNGEQYSRTNNVEISGIPNSIPDKDLENTEIRISKDYRVEIDLKDIEGCHRFPL